MGRGAIGNSSTPMSDKQAAVLRVVAEYSKSHGYPPAMRDIARALGYRSVGSVHYHIETLIRRGLLTRHAEHPRAMTLTEAGHEVAGFNIDELRKTATVFAPLFRDPQGLTGTSTELVPLPAFFAPDQAAVLVVLGNDGPTGSLIKQGDWVVVDPNAPLRAHQLLVVASGGQWVVTSSERDPMSSSVGLTSGAVLGLATGVMRRL